MSKKFVIVFKNEQSTLAVPIVFNTEVLARTFINDGLVSLPKDVSYGDLAVRSLASIT